MKLYTHATPSHEGLLRNWLLPGASREFEVVVGRSAQHGSGSFDTPGWGRNTHAKAETMYRAVAENPGQIVVWSDCDVQILRPVKDRLVELLDDADLACQHNGRGVLCSGFYVLRSNARTLRLFDRIRRSDLFDRRDTRTTDQAAMNTWKRVVGYRLLPDDEFWSVGLALGRLWDGTQPFDVPTTVRVHHANWTEGLRRKQELLEIVRRRESRSRRHSAGFPPARE